MNKKAVVAGALFLLVAIPSTVSAVDVSSAIGSTTLVNLTDVDPDLAAIAGLAKYQVTWLDGTSVLYDRDIPAADAQTVYAVANGDADPTGFGDVTPTGRTFSLVDPNGGAPWVVTEYDYNGGADIAYGVGIVTTLTDGTYGNYNFLVLVDTTVVGTNVDLYIG